MWETPDFVTETMSVLFWVSWLVLFYLAWPRLASSGRNILRKRSPGKPVKLTIPPLRPRWDRVLEQGLGRLTRLCFGLSVLELLFRRPQFERLSLPIFGLCLGLLLLLRGWRHHFRPSLERSEILFPQVMDNTALGMGLLKVQELLEKLRQIAGELISKEGAFEAIATQLLEFMESVRVFLVGIRVEPVESTVLRQAQPLFIRLETLVAAFELLARVSDAAELRRVSAGIVEILTSAKAGFAALQAERGRQLLDQVDILISVLRHLYKPAP
jgi:hypothetical protein